MKYDQHFDRLGNMYARSTASARLHRALQIVGGLAIVALLAMLYRPG